MSVESFAIALNHSRAKGTARLVLLGIANHDGDGGSWPAVATLARYAGGVDRRSVQRALETLEHLGEIRRLVGRGGDHSTADHMRPNLYQWLLACPHDCDRTRSHRTARSKATSTTFEGIDTKLYTGAALVPRGGAGAAGRGGAGAARTIPLTKPQDKEVISSPKRGRASCPKGHDLLPGLTDHCVYGCPEWEQSA